ncbi:MAG: hypothetical protein Q4D61_09360 [Cardiobacteriaceae bacterium]|nr:hypothetical protein [Cardiobacteriaceae bacterium]
MKTLLPILLLVMSAAHANSRPCTIDGWLKIRPLPNAAGDSYGDPDWPEKIPLYPTADSRDPTITLPDALLPAKWDYLGVNLLGFAENGRFRVNIEAYAAALDSTQPVTGWLDAEHIGFGLQSSHLYAKPDAQSERVLDIQGEWLHDIGDITLRNCQGEWVQIDYRQRRNPDASLTPIPEAEQQTLTDAWAHGVCSNLETTCDMPSVDNQP